DMREVIRRSEGGYSPARLAIDVYVHRLRAGVAAMAAAMNGLDALVFTGGVGENAPVVRQRAADGLKFLGIEVDPHLNGAGSGDREIGAKGAAVRTLVVVAREDLQIAREVRRLLAS
ncbi:MAG TPA: acetate/propionate family kinase, partial [Candidatus Methylomirabilis sp.]|nr:acetate/propionate family kinase [Candidatus Methylomirabilis sp.]